MGPIELSALPVSDCCRYQLAYKRFVKFLPQITIGAHQSKELNTQITDLGKIKLNKNTWGVKKSEAKKNQQLKALISRSL